MEMPHPNVSHVQVNRSSTKSITHHLFPLVLAVWLLFPVLTSWMLTQDALSMLAAGKLARTDSTQIYGVVDGDMSNLKPSFAKAWCDLAPAGTDCERYGVAYLSAPNALPVLVLLTTFGTSTGTFLFRLFAAITLVMGMEVLWRRLAHRSPHAPWLLVVSAVLLTPVALVPVALGQTAPIMFLSVCLGIEATSKSKRATRAVTWATAVTFKASPVLLGALLLKKSTRPILAMSLGILGLMSAVALFFAPMSLWIDFINETLAVGRASVDQRYNGSPAAVIARLTTIDLISILLRIGAAGATCWYGMKQVQDDVKWAIGYLAVLLVSPLVWSHYLWVVFGSIAILVAAQRRVTDACVSLLPLTALCLTISAVAHLRSSPIPMFQAATLVMGTVISLLLVRRIRLETNTAAF